MKSQTLVASLALLTCLTSAASAQEKLKVLIVDGQNNHDMWPKTTMMMKQYFEDSGRFESDVERSKFTFKGEKFLKEFALEGFETESFKNAKTDPDFAPEFEKYDVVVTNFGWGAAPWPEETQQSFEKFVAKGGGLVVVHAADNSFPEWPAYNEMIGIGGWGDRNEKSGPYVYLNKEEKEIRDTSPGRGGSHGPRHEFQIVIRNDEHPITKGLPRAWMHSSDELYQQLRGPATNMTILATAYADPSKKGMDRHEPMLMTINYKEGRVFHTTLGHDDVSFECVGMITTLLRGTEWAATGKVTLTDVPEDFPSNNESSRREFAVAVGAN